MKACSRKNKIRASILSEANEKLFFEDICFFKIKAG
jgi:hypothetical protein